MYNDHFVSLFHRVCECVHVLTWTTDRLSQNFIWRYVKASHSNVRDSNFLRLIVIWRTRETGGEHVKRHQNCKMLCTNRCLEYMQLLLRSYFCRKWSNLAAGKCSDFGVMATGARHVTFGVRTLCVRWCSKTSATNIATMRNIGVTYPTYASRICPEV